MEKYTLEYYLKKDEEKKMKLRAYYLNKKYKLSHEDYNKILLSQNNCCAICKTNISKKKLAVDHDHITGKNRGLLCVRCNAGLGYFMDNIDFLSSAIDYLKKNKLSTLA